MLLCAIFAAPAAIAQDISIKSAGYYVELGRGLTWSGLNRTFIVSPQNPDQSVCLFIVNNNPTNAHTFSLNVSLSGDQSVADFSNNQGRWTNGSAVGLPSSVAALSTVTAYVHSNAAAKIAFRFGGASAAAGSPDTADLFAVQTSATNCGAVNPQTGQTYSVSTPNTGTAAPSTLQAISDGTSQSWMSQISAVNPAANFLLLSVNDNNESRSLYFDKLLLSSSVAGSVNVYLTTDKGNTCAGAGALGNLKANAVASSAASAFSGPCTGNPSAWANTSFTIFFAANSLSIVDLRAMIAQSATTTGIAVVNATALTGTVSTSVFWYEQ